MLHRSLKYSLTSGYLIIALLTVIAWLPAFQTAGWQQMAFDNNAMPLYVWISGLINPNDLASEIIAMTLVMLSGFYLLRINVKYSLLRERALFPAFFFILIVSSITVLHRLHPILFAILFFLPAIDKLLDSYKTDGLSHNYFEASFLIGAASLFYFNFIYFFVIVLIALLILRPVIWREWILSILGILTPWFFFFMTEFLIHESVEHVIDLIANNFTASDNSMFIFLPEQIFFLLLVLLIIVSSRNILISMAKMRVLTRKIFVLFFWIFIEGIAIYMLVETANIEMIVPASIPVSFLFSNYLLSLRSAFWSNLILWSFVIIIQVMVWLPLVV